jgi:imidazolonepropionase-like amidohydrolase
MFASAILAVALATALRPPFAPSLRSGQALRLSPFASLDTLQYVILNHGRAAGEMRVITGGDSAMVRYVYQDRQRGPRLETKYKFGTNGTVLKLEQRGINAEMFPGDVNHAWEATPAGQGRFYIIPAQTPYDQALLAAHLLKQPNRTAPLLPVGEGKVEIVADTTVSGPGGSRRVRLAMLSGMDGSYDAIWLDQQDRVFASGAGWFLTIPRGWERTEAALRAIELRWRARQTEDVARRLDRQAPGLVVIRNGDLFDSETGSIRPRMTVVISGDRIQRVGPADSVPIPQDVRVFDATGKTVIPGLWDMHTHAILGSEQAGLMHLGAGVTTVRDMAADIDVAVSHRDRSAKGTMIGPRMILGGFIEGPGFWAGPSEVLVRTEAEARAWVARYDSLGYKQIKLYNLVHPDLVPAITDETHKRGMRLSGHIPRGLTLEAAVRLGFDEVNHMAFLFSTFFQDSLYLPRMRAYSQVSAEVAPTFNVESGEVTALLGFLREKGTVVDGTFNIWQNRAFTLPDGNDPVFGPTIAWMPPLLKRGMAQGAAPTPQARGRMLAADVNYRRMLKRVYDAGITMVPGTDNIPGLALLGELEIYERAGIPAASVLQIATIVPARVMKDDKDYGSIAAGKVADIVIVNGRPAERITDLRKVETVIRAGRVFRSLDLFREAGLNPTP